MFEGDNAAGLEVSVVYEGEGDDGRVIVGCVNAGFDAAWTVVLPDDSVPPEVGDTVSFTDVSELEVDFTRTFSRSQLDYTGSCSAEGWEMVAPHH